MTMETFKATTGLMSGSHHLLRVEPSGAHTGRVFLSLHASGEGGHISRETVAELRDWLTDWLEETEVKLPTAYGSRIRACKGGEYILIPREASGVRWGSGETVWMRTNGEGWWDPLFRRGAYGLEEVLFDAGKVDQ